MFCRQLITSKRKGSALILSVLAVIVLFVMGGGLLALGLNSRVFYVRTSSDIAARCAADAALTKAIYEINQKFQAGDLSELPQEVDISLDGCNATYSYQIIQQDGGNYVVQATGTSNGASRTVQANLQINNPFDFAILTQQDLTMKSGSVIDWYNYDGDDTPLKVGTNSTNTAAVDLQSLVTINGDVVVGAGGNPDEVISTDSSTNITGDTYAQTNSITLESVTVPAHLSAMASGGVINNDTTISSSGKYDGINLGHGETITVAVEGPVELYITGDIDLGNSAIIELDDTFLDSSLTIYLAGNLVSDNSSTIINSTETPRNLKIYGLDTCTALDFKNSSILYGVIYAPNADVVFHNSVDIYGSVIGNSLEFKSSSNMYYDASLRDMRDDALVSLDVERWTE